MQSWHTSSLPCQVGRDEVQSESAREQETATQCRRHLYRLWSLLLRGLLLGGVLRIEELGHVENERGNRLGEIHLRDVVGRELLTDAEFGQCCLLGLAQPKCSAHHIRSLLFKKEKNTQNVKLQ